MQPHSSTQPHSFPELANKTLVMLVGPTATGKSTVIAATNRLDTSFSYVQSFTSRAQRDLNDNSYMFLPAEQAKRLHESGQTVTFIEHPTTGDIYGTTESSYRTEYCVLDTLFNSVNDYRSLPFSRTIAISITVPADTWVHYFLIRFPVESEEGKKRLEEARLSIQWSLAQTSDHAWVINDGAPDEAARKVIAVARGGSKGDDGADTARQLLAKIDQGVW